MSTARFCFDSYEYSDERLTFTYRYVDDQGHEMAKFSERFRLPVAIQPDNPVTSYILRQLHIIVGISYYKSLRGMVDMPYQLSEPEANYWNTVYDNGLGEFSYVNKLTEPIRPFHAKSQAVPLPTPLQLSGALVGVGGGKDSIVASEILRGVVVETTLLDMSTRDNQGQAGAVMNIMNLPQLHVQRYVDTSIVSFSNANGGLHGHIPLSAILAWLGVLIAQATGKQYVIMANESASSVGNTVWNGKTVNHQWSKSFEFEQLTQSFIHSHISKDLWYFSPIRAYGSLAIMDLFAKLGTQYLQDFTSCNLVLRIDPTERPNGRWCTHCAKCLSTWLLLATWLDTARLTNIFGRNLFDDTSLRPLLKQLLGLSGHKPLDCVGTTEELRAAARYILETDVSHPLLEDLEIVMLDGPSVGDLLRTRGDSSLPSELQQPISDFVTATLGAH